MLQVLAELAVMDGLQEAAPGHWQHHPRPDHQLTGLQSGRALPVLGTLHARKMMLNSLQCFSLRSNVAARSFRWKKMTYLKK